MSWELDSLCRYFQSAPLAASKPINVRRGRMRQVLRRGREVFGLVLVQGKICEPNVHLHLYLYLCIWPGYVVVAGWCKEGYMCAKCVFCTAFATLTLV